MKDEEEFQCSSWLFFSYSRWPNGLSIWFEISAFPRAISSNLGRLGLHLYFQDRSFDQAL